MLHLGWQYNALVPLKILCSPPQFNSYCICWNGNHAVRHLQLRWLIVLHDYLSFLYHDWTPTCSIQLTMCDMRKFMSTCKRFELLHLLKQLKKCNCNSVIIVCNRLATDIIRNIARIIAVSLAGDQAMVSGYLINIDYTFSCRKLKEV